MTDIETLLERLENLASNKRGISWDMAEVADEIVGKRIPGATKQAALVCGIVSPDAVEHWAKAYRLYRVIRYKSGLSETYKKEFSVSHFYKMWELGHKYKLSLDEILNHFFMLLTHKYHGDRWSVAELEMLVLAEQTNVKEVNWRWHWNRVESHIMALLTFDGGLPVTVRAWARMYKGLKGKVK